MFQEPFAQNVDSASNPDQTESGQESISLANTNDQASHEDSLGFSPYVTAVASFLTNEDTKPPLVMSVEGEWGTGKTSFMRQLEHALRTEKKQRFTVWFNPWRHDSEDAVWAAFAMQFVEGISKSQWFGRRWLGHIRLFLRRFRWEEGWLDLLRKGLLWFLILAFTTAIGVYAYLSRGQWTQQIDDLTKTITAVDDLQSLIGTGIGAGGVLAYVFLWLSILNKITAIVGDPLKLDLKKYVDSPNYEERVSFVERFHEDFQKVVEAYAGKETVFVFIDDVDRCEVPKAADLMSALNLMISGDTRLVFIIGMDREKVAAGLAVKHEKLLPFLHVSRYETGEGEDKDARLKLMGLEFGYEFIEKFVQLPFILPRPDDAALGDFLNKISRSKVTAGAPNQGGTVQKLPWLTRAFSNTSNAGEARGDANLSLPSTGSSVSLPSDLADRRESIIIQAGTDSDRIHNIIKVVAPAFENNPRRLKQFINLFRLRVYIAAETGLFDYKQTRETILDNKGLPTSGLKQSVFAFTLEQLGKIVAITLRWPLLLADMELAPNLLNDLQKLALDPKAEVTTSAVRLSRWRYRPDLLSFLSAGMPLRAAEAGERNVSQSRWSLENVNFAEIMRVAPRVRKVAGAAETARIKTAKPVPAKTFGDINNNPPVTQIMTTYVFGDDLYDDSFSIDSTTGDFLGEMGVGSTDYALLGSGTPKKFQAFEIWLFDKNDIRTQTKIIISEYGNTDPQTLEKMSSRGSELVLPALGKQVVLETTTLKVVATIADYKYREDKSSPANSYFEKLTIELAAWQKEADVQTYHPISNK